MFCYHDIVSQNVELAEENCVMPSPTKPISLSGLTEGQRTTLRHSWCVFHSSTNDSAAVVCSSTHDSAVDSSQLSTADPAITTTTSGLFQSMFDSSGVAHNNRKGTASEEATLPETSYAGEIRKTSDETGEDDRRGEEKMELNLETESKMTDSSSHCTSHRSTRTTETSITDIGRGRANSEPCLPKRT